MIEALLIGVAPFLVWWAVTRLIDAGAKAEAERNERKNKPYGMDL